MNHCRIILSLAISLAGCQAWSQQQVATTPAPITTYPGAPIPQATIIAGPPYLQPTPMIQPVPQVAPVYPPHSTVVPLPSHTPGSIFGSPLVTTTPGTLPPTVPAPPSSPLAAFAPGGLVSQQFGLPAGPDAVSGPANPIVVPVADEELAWDQIVDVVSDYFTVAGEQGARRDGEMQMEGRIETAPQVGATGLEPQRRDSVGSFNRWESTFQTIRRRATVRVIPDPAGYLVEVIIEKELEDLPKPEHATAGAAAFRNDSSLPSRRLEQAGLTHSSPRWLSLGRDPALEQRMLAEIHARLTGVLAGAGSVFAQ